MLLEFLGTQLDEVNTSLLKNTRDNSVAKVSHLTQLPGDQSVPGRLSRKLFTAQSSRKKTNKKHSLVTLVPFRVMQRYCKWSSFNSISKHPCLDPHE